MAKTPEALYQDKVLRFLKKQPGLYCFKKEAKAIRGIPDIIGCWNGRFFAIELKKSSKEIEKNSDRIVLQRYTITKIKEAGGFAIFSCPETFDSDMKDLATHCLKTSYFVLT